MPLYLINCTYCDYSQKVDYLINKYSTCMKCKDRNLTIKDISAGIDYYAGTTPHKKDKKTKEIVMLDIEEDDLEDSLDSNLAYIPGRWD